LQFSFQWFGSFVQPSLAGALLSSYQTPVPPLTHHEHEAKWEITANENKFLAKVDPEGYVEGHEECVAWLDGKLILHGKVTMAQNNTHNGNPTSPGAFGLIRGSRSDGRAEFKSGRGQFDASLEADKKGELKGSHLPPHDPERKLVLLPLAQQFRERMAAAKRARSSH